MKHKDTDRNSNISQTLGLTSRKPGKRLKRWILWGLIALGITGLVIRWDMGKNTAKIQYKTQAATKGSLTVTVTATGNLEPTNKVDVSSELSGIIKTVEVDYNDEVKVGQVLARLDTTKLQTQVLQSRAALEAAGAKVVQVGATIKEGRDQLGRLTDLVKMSGSKAVSKHDLDAAEAVLARALADEASAKASVHQAQAVLSLNETDLSKALIRSPINGIVLTRAVEPGQTVAASLQAPVLFTLAQDLTQMKLPVNVDEADVGNVIKGQKANFTVGAYPDRTFPAQITQVRFGFKTKGGVVTYETLLYVDNADLSLRPGMTATADIVVKEIENAVLAPNAALRFSPPADKRGAPSQGGGVLTKLFPRPPSSSPPKQRGENSKGKKQQRVWMLQNGELHPVSIRSGLSDGTLTEIIEGDVTPGMELVVDTLSENR
jgi:HlyD family secretion protein